MIIHKDTYGSIIQIGSKVAFNWCGAVRIGYVVDIKKAKKILIDIMK